MASCTSASGCCAARQNTACSSRSLRCRTAGAALRSRARKLWLQAHKVGGIDILLTHAPASGLNDGTDRAHKGFVCFNELLDEYQPAWFVHGHVHLNYDAKLPRVCTRGNTTVINATERYVFEIPDPDPLQKRKFLWGSAKK